MNNFIFKVVKILAIAMLLPLAAIACDISFSVDGKVKPKYEITEIVVIKVKVELTHNNCPITLKDTKIQGIGMDILGATEWKNTSPNVWERKLKVKVTSTKEGKATVTAKRSCEKDGGWGTFTLMATPLQ
jgi:preprotein translocase subunit SecB